VVNKVGILTSQFGSDTGWG